MIASRSHIGDMPWELATCLAISANDEYDVKMELAAELEKALLAKGSEFQIGMDTSRLWSNGVQAFLMGETSVVIFREQAMLAGTNGELEVAIKNVASIVVPTQSLREFSNALTIAFTNVDAAIVASGTSS